MEMELREGIAAQIVVPQGARDVLVFDSKQPGFFLRKFRSGRAIWGVKYSIGGKQRRKHLYDASVRGTLAKARREAADVRAKARLGTDVVAEVKAAQAAADRSIALDVLADRYLADRRATWKSRYYLEVKRHLKKDWAPLAATPIQSVARGDIVKVVDDVATAQGRVAADRARSALSGLYTWAIDRGYCDATPVVHIKPRAANGARERTLTAAELREVWAAAGTVGGDYGRIVKLLILTGQRRDEIGRLDWSEVVRQGDDIRIELSGERTKNHRRHVTPLSRQAVMVLPAKRNSTTKVFGRFSKGFSGWSKAKRDIDAEIAKARAESGIEEPMPSWRLHDLRRTFVTMVGELGFAPPHVIEACVNHVSGTKAGVAGTYNRAIYMEERRQAMDAWGRHVEKLLE